ncbi:MAG TPA: sigma-70 family RNA polymerase sigma factor [Acidimicrobiia bacterium]|nr:sigma-70 family RNA polymerase sigma factor [Acidimicrobiia bacterium]
MNSGVDSAPAVELIHGRFEEFYTANWERIYRALAVMLRNPDLAAEATDEAMTRAFQRWAVIRSYDNPTGWVYRVALNWARSRLRRHSREYSGDGTDSAYEPVLPEPEVHRAIAALPDHHREVVVLRYLLDWSEGDIAAALGVPAGTVKSRLNRALSRLREELEP